jgi:DNA-binding beta-propeller fold protein YncE
VYSKLTEPRSASYDNVSFSVATEETGPKGIAFKPDGTRMFLTGSGTDKVYQYDLSTAWDVSTASYNNVSAGIFTGGFNPWGINFKPDGTMMFLCGVASNVIQRIDLSTAWDLSTAGNPSDRSLTGITSFPSGIVLKPDGTRFIIVSRSDDTLYQFDCGTAWQTESSTYNNVSFSVTNQATQPEGVEVNSDGTKLFVSCSNTDTVYQYSLSTAWDLSTASYDNVSFSLASQDGTPSGVKFKPDGLKMYMVGDVNNTVYQYSTGTATTLDLSTGNYLQQQVLLWHLLVVMRLRLMTLLMQVMIMLVLVWLLKKQLLLVCSLNLTELKCILLAGPHPLL